MNRRITVVDCIKIIILFGIFKTGQCAYVEAEYSQTKEHFFDLGHTLDESNIFFPGQHFNYELYKDWEGYNETQTPEHLKYFLATFSFCMGEHGGTHMDAPFHLNPKGWKPYEIPPSHLVDVRTTIVDVEKYVFALENPDQFVLQVEHLLEHEKLKGKIPYEGVVLIHYGWSRFWNDRDKYTGQRQDGTFNFPGMSGAAAKWLVEHRRIVGVGVDAMSVDVGNNKGYNIAHMTILGNQGYFLENLTNLDKLLDHVRTQLNCDLRLIALPIKSRGTGGPVRVMGYCKH